MAEHLAYKGLSQSEVENQRQAHGANVLTPPKTTPLWKIYLLKFKDPMIIILLVALALSFGISFHEGFSTGNLRISNFLEPIGILFAILLSTGIAFYFEQKAAREFNLLNQINDETLYKVVRDGKIRQIQKHEIVVGDILIVETGEELPADGRILESTSLQVNESSLTGELLANKYAVIPDDAEETPYPADHLYRGTVIIEGHGVMEVTQVGDHTEAGKVFTGLSISDEVQTPLQVQLTRLARFISYTGYAIALLVVVGRTLGFFHQGMYGSDWHTVSNYFLDSFMLAVTILVVAVPEGLPMSVSLSLAYSMRSMMKTNNLVRRMHACETMGATTVICTDKTGTLTRNQMRVHAIMGCDGREIDALHDLAPLLFRSIAANSTAHLEKDESGEYTVLGNPTEGALLLWMQTMGQDYMKVRSDAQIETQLTFSTERKYMATLLAAQADDPNHFSENPQPRELLVKGAPEIIFSMCQTAMRSDGTLIPIADRKEILRATLEGYQGQGMRTLAIARYLPEADDQLFADGRVHVEKMTLVAIAAISDPVRENVPAAIEECRAAGVNVKIVTGDTLLTTREIARKIGLWNDACGDASAMSGAEFAAMSDEEVMPKLESLRIMYRARPLDKARLTGLLQQAGEIVAVTGDGTNDAPALRAAHVGLSMGDGTAVAKEASDITILDNSFVSIGQAILWGRSLYQNIQRFIVFQMTINLAACLVVLAGAFLGSKSPLTVTQMLWINLIMDTLAALALASLPPDRTVMKRKPRKPKDFIITRKMIAAIVSTGLIFVFALYGLLELFMYTHHNSADTSSIIEIFENVRNVGSIIPTNMSREAYNAITRYELSIFFSMFVFMQLWNLFNAKAFASGRSAFHDLRNSKKFLLVLGIVFLCQWILMAFGGALFSIEPLHWIDQFGVVLITSLVLLLPEFVRAIRRLCRKDGE